ncbi:MAG TPA: hypothetical protein V6D16_21100 [Candidatus Obscuribacterales bacterium]
MRLQTQIADPNIIYRIISALSGTAWHGAIAARSGGNFNLLEVH